jgi:hypothetical protein
MTVSCLRCGQEWLRDPALEVECPTCHMAIGVKCRRPSGHDCDIHPKRDRLPMDLGYLQRCTAAATPEEADTLPLFANCQPPVPLLEQLTTHDGESP